MFVESYGDKYFNNDKYYLFINYNNTLSFIYTFFEKNCKNRIFIHQL